jgi:hypothetical protein
MSVHLGKPPLLFAVHVNLNTGTSEVSTSPRRLEETDDPGRERESTSLIGQQIKAATRVQQIEGGAMRELDVVNESQYVKSESRSDLFLLMKLFQLGAKRWYLWSGMVFKVEVIACVCCCPLSVACAIATCQYYCFLVPVALTSLCLH